MRGEERPEGKVSLEVCCFGLTICRVVENVNVRVGNADIQYNGVAAQRGNEQEAREHRLKQDR
jgi:hypothetical protein